ncbi:MAG TPA: hypothetical protein VML75_14490, partial [Kofleriaceae bacterium]|nr:hypothetical protein [Kofleriaceae bacterium]
MPHPPDTAPMLFLEAHARLLLVLHAISAGALVAASTHLVVWMRGYPRGRFQRHRGVRRFAWIVAGLFLATFVLGNLAYPTYKVRVRGQYLDMPGAIEAERQARSEAQDRLLAYENQIRQVRGQPPAAPPGSLPPAEPGDAARAALWFDVKEHWVALGLGMSMALVLMVSAWDPRKHGARVAPLVFWMAVGT